MTEDMKLLGEYALQRSEAAFRTLTERHIGMVYSAILRQVNDPSIAEEGTQSVFMLLAGKAHQLPQNTIISGWLYRTARYVASDILKTQRRRRRREQQAAQMQTSSGEDSIWRDI